MLLKTISVVKKRLNKQLEVEGILITIDEAVLLGDRIYVMSRRPGTIRDVVEVDIPDERNHHSLVRPEFIAVKEKIMEMLWQESMDAASGR